MTRSMRPALALASVVPILVLGAGALVGPLSDGSSDRSVERAETTSSPSAAALVCPGPVQVPKELQGSTGDQKLSSTGPNGRVGVRTLGLDADSSLLFGRVAASSTRQDADGNPLAPSITAADAAGEDLGIDTSTGDVGASAQTISSISNGPKVTVRGSQDQQVVADAVQTTTTDSGDFRSLSATRCTGASTQATFLGASTASGASASLLLRSTTDRPATASIQVWTADGPADMGGRSQVVVAPGKEERVLLESIVPDQDVIGVSVSTVGAPLAMSLQDTERDGLTPLGGEILSDLPEASRSSVIPGVRIGKGTSAQVVLMNESGADAHVQLAAHDAKGPVDVSGLDDEVTVPAGSVTTVPVEGIAGDFAITAESDQKVSAAVRSHVQSEKKLGKTIGKPSDLAVAQAAPALRDSGVIALPTDGAHGALSLAATDDTHVTVIPVGADGGAGESVELDLAGDSATDIPAGDLKGTKGGIAGLVVVPDDPDAVHAAWIQTESDAKAGPLLTSVPVVSASTGGSGTTVRLG